MKWLRTGNRNYFEHYKIREEDKTIIKNKIKRWVENKMKATQSENKKLRKYVRADQDTQQNTKTNNITVKREYV